MAPGTAVGPEASVPAATKYLADVPAAGSIGALNETDNTLVSRPIPTPGRRDLVSGQGPPSSALLPNDAESSGSFGRRGMTLGARRLSSVVPMLDDGGTSGSDTSDGPDRPAAADTALSASSLALAWAPGASASHAPTLQLSSGPASGTGVVATGAAIASTPFPQAPVSRLQHPTPSRWQSQATLPPDFAGLATASLAGAGRRASVGGVPSGPWGRVVRTAVDPHAAPGSADGSAPPLGRRRSSLSLVVSSILTEQLPPQAHLSVAGWAGGGARAAAPQVAREAWTGNIAPAPAPAPLRSPAASTTPEATATVGRRRSSLSHIVSSLLTEQQNASPAGLSLRSGAPAGHLPGHDPSGRTSAAGVAPVASTSDALASQLDYRRRPNAQLLPQVPRAPGSVVWGRAQAAATVAVALKPRTNTSTLAAAAGASFYGLRPAPDHAATADAEVWNRRRSV